MGFHNPEHEQKESDHENGIHNQTHCCNGKFGIRRRHAPNIRLVSPAMSTTFNSLNRSVKAQAQCELNHHPGKSLPIFIPDEAEASFDRDQHRQPGPG